MCTEARDIVAYVIDFGVWSSHPEFETPSRVLPAVDFSFDKTDRTKLYTADNTDGCSQSSVGWHGTAVASTLAGTSVGAAKVKIQPLKVIACQGAVNLSFYMNALDWIADPINNPNYNAPGVVSHSGYIPVWDPSTDANGLAMYTAYGDAVSRLVTGRNLPFFTSANNYAGDACQFSPAYTAYTRTNHSGTVFTVAASTVNPNDPNDPYDYRWQVWNADGSQHLGFANGIEGGSNGGSCVSAYALATGVYHAATPALGTSYRYDSGTSFAAPLAAGLAARYISKQIATPGYTTFC